MHSINTNVTIEQHQQTGFTLIEVMIVITIMGVIGTLAAPSMSQQLEKRRIDSAERSIVSFHKEAQVEAKINHKPVTVAYKWDDDKKQAVFIMGRSGDKYYKEMRLASNVRIYNRHGQHNTGNISYDVRPSGHIVFKTNKAINTGSETYSYCVSTVKSKTSYWKIIKYDHRKIGRVEAPSDTCSML